MIASPPLSRAVCASILFGLFAALAPAQTPPPAAPAPAGNPPPAGVQPPEEVVPTTLLAGPDDLEVTLWARAPQLRNPTNIDVDAQGRVWVTQAVNYRRHSGNSRPA